MATDIATQTLEDWQALAEKALKGASLDTLRWRADDGFLVEPLYARREDATPVAARGGGAPWAITARVDHPDPKRANAQALEDLAGGASSLDLLFRDAPSAHGFGLPVEEAALRTALQGVHLDAIPLRVSPHPRAGETANWLSELAEERGHDLSTLDIAFGVDPIGVFARYGGSADRIKEGNHLSSGATFEADGRVYHDAGATDGQELAAVLATAVAYLRAIEARSNIGFTLAVDQDQFASTAKVRALRLLWRRVEEASGLDATPVRIHAETSWRMTTARDPHGNLLRSTIAAFAAGVGGADSLSVLPFTQARGLPDAFARRMARDTQLLLLEESHVHRVADPSTGAGAIEALTDGLCEAAWAEFQRIEREGGIVASLEAGALQERIGEAREELAAELQAGERVLVGSTFYPPPEPIEVAVEDAEPWPAIESGEGALMPVRLEEMAR